MSLNIRTNSRTLQKKIRSALKARRTSDGPDTKNTSKGVKYTIKMPLPPATIQILIPEGYGSLNNKDLVMIFHAFDKDQNQMSDSVIQLPYSSSLKAPYSYLTYRDRDQLVLSTRSFSIGGDVHSLHAELLPWSLEGKKLIQDREGLRSYSILKFKSNSQTWIGKLKND